jgi:hypothetical protein
LIRSEQPNGGRESSGFPELPMPSQVQRRVPSRTPSNPAYFQGIEAAAPSFGVDSTRADVRNAADIERTITAFAQQPNGGCFRLVANCMGERHFDQFALKVGVLGRPTRLCATLFERTYTSALPVTVGWLGVNNL